MIKLDLGALFDAQYILLISQEFGRAEYGQEESEKESSPVVPDGYSRMSPQMVESRSFFSGDHISSDQ